MALSLSFYLRYFPAPHDPIPNCTTGRDLSYGDTRVYNAESNGCGAGRAPPCFLPRRVWDDPLRLQGGIRLLLCFLGRFLIVVVSLLIAMFAAAASRAERPQTRSGERRIPAATPEALVVQRQRPQRPTGGGHRGEEAGRSRWPPYP